MGFDTADDFTAAGGAIKAFSAIGAGNAKDALERQNENIAGQQARSEMESGAYNASLARKKGAAVTGAQVAAIGANNLQMKGTPTDVVASTAAAQEANVLAIQNNALRRAWGFEVQGASDRYQGQLAKRGGMLSGIGDLIGAGGKITDDRSRIAGLRVDPNDPAYGEEED